MTKFIVDDPNFSIIMPGGCNAKCNFCYYHYFPDTELDQKVWIKKLYSIVKKLPKQFTQCSITGGEPTLNPKLLFKVLHLIRKRFSKIVLNTNSTGLNDYYISEIILPNKLVDYINISRHSNEDHKNYKIFKTLEVFSTTKLRHFISYSHRFGIPVTINCIVTKPLDVNKMIDYCYTVQAYALRLREKSKNAAKEILSTDKILSYSKPLYKESTGYI